MKYITQGIRSGIIFFVDNILKKEGNYACDTLSLSTSNRRIINDTKV